MWLWISPSSSLSNFSGLKLNCVKFVSPSLLFFGELWESFWLLKFMELTLMVKSFVKERFLLMAVFSPIVKAEVSFPAKFKRGLLGLSDSFGLGDADCWSFNLLSKKDGVLHKSVESWPDRFCYCYTLLRCWRSSAQTFLMLGDSTFYEFWTNSFVHILKTFKQFSKSCILISFSCAFSGASIKIRQLASDFEGKPVSMLNSVFTWFLEGKSGFLRIKGAISIGFLGEQNYNDFYNLFRLAELTFTVLATCSSSEE